VSERRRLSLRLRPAAEAAVRGGHPWVFADGIKSRNREGEAGELAVVYDRRDRFLAVGLYDPGSPIRLRVLAAGKPVRIDRGWWLARAREALARRAGVLGPGTSGARCLAGESEGFPGLVADRYGDTLVVKLYAGSWLARWDEVEGVLREVMAPRFLVRRFSRNLESAAEAAGLAAGFVGAAGPDPVVFEENGLRFEAAVTRGQKTGFFLVQRDNRARVGELAGGREVLNLFSYTGGFSLYAARGGARRVVDVDQSAPALEGARRNFALNRGDPAVAAAVHETWRADVLGSLREGGERFDLVVVDPPALAKGKAERERALRAYRRLNAAALERLRPGGVLVAASCTAHVRDEEYFALVRELAGRGGRRWRELWTSGHPPDHPAAFAEAEYLKAIAVRVE